MPRFGRKSKERLATCDKRLQDVFNEVIKHVDCSVLEGNRNEERQNKLFDEGKQKLNSLTGGIIVALASLLMSRLIPWTGATESDRLFLLVLCLGLLIVWVSL